ncbi:hypothetical protein F6X40_27810 [Paraburkholderia sp. UCT31]|uniref:hypothetical protein n=1 Tax=Paraburkholderia sp. UCT31 TaxID=2615209 RepID=UPI001655B1B7|nr:hypothetical protein [Paraburkholderia sp. UCT31]MBC8740446.1 hypothetical protein [Paraburkholderia sp. UCT31]
MTLNTPRPLLDKSKLQVSARLCHARLGRVFFTDECLMLEKLRGRRDTLFVEFDGDVREVTLELVHEAPSSQ